MMMKEGISSLSLAQQIKKIEEKVASTFPTVY
jgi:hypothetical protein